VLKVLKVREVLKVLRVREVLKVLEVRGWCSAGLQAC